jgi:RNA polymerase sigma-70 factor (ECF subfamily)
MQEKSAFEELFRKHNKALCDLAYNIVSDADAAKDIVQDVFIKLWNNRSNIELGGQIRNYLFKATSHTALNYLRSIKRLDRLGDRSEVSRLEATSDHESVGYKEFELRVRESIDRLPPKCKAIYILSRHEGLKYQEIADSLGLSLKTVENQMGIALEKLRDQLKPFLTLESIAYLILAGIAVYFSLFH